MHKLTALKVAGAIEAASATLIYLPKYLPDLNPIEMAFSKLKAHLRKAPEHTVPRLLRRIGRVVTDFAFLSRRPVATRSDHTKAGEQERRPEIEISLAPHRTTESEPKSCVY